MKSFLTVVGLVGVLGTSATAQDWGGFYAGGSFGSHDGDKCYAGASPCPEFFIDGQDGSIFGGYNLTSGAWVYGAELSASITGDAPETVDTDFILSNFVDLKLRGGYAYGQGLYFASIGYSVADADEAGDYYDAEGALLSVGADFFLTDNLFVGTEYTRRFLTGAGGTPNEFDVELDTFSLRLGYNF